VGGRQIPGQQEVHRKSEEVRGEKVRVPNEKTKGKMRDRVDFTDRRAQIRKIGWSGTPLEIKGGLKGSGNGNQGKRGCSPDLRRNKRGSHKGRVPRQGRDKNGKVLVGPTRTQQQADAEKLEKKAIMKRTDFERNGSENVRGRRREKYPKDEKCSAIERHLGEKTRSGGSMTVKYPPIGDGKVKCAGVHQGKRPAEKRNWSKGKRKTR